MSSRLERDKNTIMTNEPDDLELSELAYELEDESEELKPDEEGSFGAVDITRLYLNDIGKIKMLSEEEEQELGYRIYAGKQAEELLKNGEDEQLLAKVKDGEAAQMEMVEANLRLVVSNARRYQGQGLDLLDVINEGNLGLIKAAKRYDITKGFRFSTYATWWIRQAIQRGLADQSKAIRVPVHMTETIHKVNRVRGVMASELGRVPTDEELAERLNMSLKKLKDILSYMREVVSLDNPVGDDSEATLGDFVEASADSVPEKVGIMGALHENIYDILERFSEKEAEIIKLRFGFYGKVYTLEEVGKIFGLTRERIRQIEGNTINKIRKTPSMTKELMEYWANGLAS